MNRVLEFLRGQIINLPEVSDRHLLDRFLGARDEAAFAELVRRHGPVVWGVCRRLANTHDAEDAFQATFLVLVRRANRLGTDVPLGPWLHRVAVMTARNVLRGNRRRAVVSGPMDHEVSQPATGSEVERLDLDAALLALPERYRAPVVLCHLQGMTRREAATQLGCPEGTLSARLNRALARLRARLGGRVVAALAVAGPVVTPAALSAATVRAAVVYTTSTLTAAGVSPAVAGLTDGVLRMFWVKKLTAGLVLAVLVAGALFAGLVTRSGSVAQATEPQAPAEDPEAAAKRLDKQLADLQKQKELLNAMMADLQAEKKQLDETKKAKAAAAELGDDIAVMVAKGSKSPQYTIREVVNGKVGEMRCSDLDVLAKYLTRAFNDPKGPKKLRIHADQNFPQDQLKDVFAVCAAAGYKKASFRQPQALFIASDGSLLGTSPLTANNTLAVNPSLTNKSTFTGPLGLATNQGVLTKPLVTGNTTLLYGNTLNSTTLGTVQLYTFPREIDLTKYAPKKP
jgi:RNA polymerase sigma factor (sigma-70 family)